jgi:spermidine synthase
MPIYKNWFSEKNVPGKRKGNVEHRFLIEKLIFKGKTPYQNVLIFKNKTYGIIFCLEDIVQFSQKDEFIYHEMMTHPVLFSHPRAKDVLIIGGGDGGVLREVLKHKTERVDLVEIDKKIIEISKRYLRFVCRNSFNDKRVKIYYEDGKKFLKKQNRSSYDLVFIDSTNPYYRSISFSLYSLDFYKDLFRILKNEGIFISLGFSFLDFNPSIKALFKKIKKVFPYVSLLRFTMPSYHCGEYAFLIGSKKFDLEKIDFKKIQRRFHSLKKGKAFRYYSPQIHKASLTMPSLWNINLYEKF